MTECVKTFMVFVWVLIFGAALIVTGCAPPQVGPPGPSGIQGPVGLTGADGVTGPAGSDANSVTVVQLCPGSTSVYPNTFAEVAFCIDNQLYGTYSSNGGFSTLLPPGAYSSDGINRSCNLTILPNCIVQN